MKYSLNRLGVVALLAALLSPVALAQSDSRPAIHVQGSGAVALVPDAFTVTLVLEQRGPVVTKLNTQMAANLEAIVSYLLEQGVPKQNIQSMQVRLDPWVEHGPNGREDKGFVLSRQIRVMHSDLQSYDKLLDGVLGRGVNRIQQFEFITSSEDKAYQQALIQAVSDARARAQLLAGELGVKVAEVLSVSEQGYSQPVPMMKVRAMDSEMSPSLPGQQQVEAHVQVSFAIGE